MGSTELQQYCLECCEKTVQCTTWICFAVRRLHCTAWIHSAVRRLHCTAWICCSTAKISTAVHCSRRSIRPWIIWIFDSCDLATGIAARKPTLITINMLICTHGCPQYRYKLSWVDRRRFWRRFFLMIPLFSERVFGNGASIYLPNTSVHKTPYAATYFCFYNSVVWIHRSSYQLLLHKKLLKFRVKVSDAAVKGYVLKTDVLGNIICTSRHTFQTQVFTKRPIAMLLLLLLLLLLSFCNMKSERICCCRG